MLGTLGLVADAFELPGCIPMLVFHCACGAEEGMKKEPRRNMPDAET